MSNEVNMPADFWPDHVLVTGKLGDIELTFAITHDSLCSGRFKDELLPNLNGLREALWQSLHMSPEERKKYGL